MCGLSDSRPIDLNRISIECRSRSAPSSVPPGVPASFARDSPMSHGTRPTMQSGSHERSRSLARAKRGMAGGFGHVTREEPPALIVRSYP